MSTIIMSPTTGGAIEYDNWKKSDVIARGIFYVGETLAPVLEREGPTKPDHLPCDCGPADDIELRGPRGACARCVIREEDWQDMRCLTLEF
jgi:hypothetical protein